MNRDVTTSKPCPPQSCWTGSPLTNRIRKHRPELRKLSHQADPPDQKGQLRQQQRQTQQAQRDALTDRGAELPERQDQEPRKPRFGATGQ